MALLTFNQGIIAKIEPTYGTDAVPDGTDFVRVGSDLAITPVAAEIVERNQLIGHLGKTTSSILAATHKMVTFSCELTSSGTPGTPPAWGKFARACGMSETIDPGVSVTYAPTDDPDAHESLSMVPFVDGMWFKGLGARGAMTMSLARNAAGLIGSFSFLARYQANTDTANPTVTDANHAAPVAVDQQNTTGVSVLGFAACVEAIDVDLGIQTSYRNHPGCGNAIRLVGRSVTGSVNLELPTVSAFDLYAAIVGRTSGLITFAQADLAGGTVTVNVPNAVLNPTDALSDNEGVVHVSAPFEGTAPTALSDIEIVVE